MAEQLPWNPGSYLVTRKVRKLLFTVDKMQIKRLPSGKGTTKNRKNIFELPNDILGGIQNSKINHPLMFSTGNQTLKLMLYDWLG